MRGTLGFLLCLPLLAGCGTHTEPAVVQYASYEDCLLDNVGGGQSSLVTEVVIAACRSKFPSRSLNKELAAKDEGGLPTRHHDGEAGGDESFPGARTSDNPYAALVPKSKQPDVTDVFADWDAEIDADIARRAATTPSAAAFHGDPCTDDCSGHEAGWEWAQRKGITDRDDCGGRSMSFRNGCIAYAEQEP